MRKHLREVTATTLGIEATDEELARTRDQLSKIVEQHIVTRPLADELIDLLEEKLGTSQDETTDLMEFISSVAMWFFYPSECL